MWYVAFLSFILHHANHHLQPYPTNPTFRPPPPLSDALREMIYQEYFFPDQSSTVPASPFAAKSEAKTGNINQLSVKHGVSKARIEAILRLKITEKEWEKTNKVRVGSDSARVPPVLPIPCVMSKHDNLRSKDYHLKPMVNYHSSLSDTHHLPISLHVFPFPLLIPYFVFPWCIVCFLRNKR